MHILCSLCDARAPGTRAGVTRRGWRARRARLPALKLPTPPPPPRVRPGSECSAQRAGPTGHAGPAPRPRPALAKRTRCSCRRALDPKSFCVCEKRDMKETQCRPATSKPSVALSCRPGTRGCGHLGTAAPPRPGCATPGGGGPSPRVPSLRGARRTFSGTAEGKAAAGPPRARKRPLCGVTWRVHLTHGDLARWAPPRRAPCASNRSCFADPRA